MNPLPKRFSKAESSLDFLFKKRISFVIVKYALAFLFCTFSFVHAQEVNIVAVGEANLEKAAVAFVREGDNQSTKKQRGLEDKFVDLLKKDFSFYKQFFKITGHPKDAFYVGRFRFSHQKALATYTVFFGKSKNKENHF